jgi:4-azaleucine resistance transporter AzlC
MCYEEWVMHTVDDLAHAQCRASSEVPVRAEFVKGLVAVTPVLIGTLPFALVLGAQASQKGMNPAAVPFMAGLNFAGGSEFAAVHLWTSPPHIFLIVAITFLVNSRHLLMGAAFAPLIQHLPKRKAFGLLFLMCDESWALGLANAQKRAVSGIAPILNVPFYLGIATALWVNWVIFTGVGAVVGPFLGDVRTYGLDMAFPAVFFVLLRGMWKGWRPARSWIISLVAAALMYRFGPTGWYVAAGAIAGIVSTYLGAKQS